MMTARNAIKRPQDETPGDRQAAAAYIAAMSIELAAIARRFGLDALGYILEMARLEAEAAHGVGKDEMR